MLYGDNVVYYTPVEAYPVMTMDVGIISGGTGGDAAVTEGVRFFWVYNPVSTHSAPSGFTGQGWFADVNGSPIWYSTENNNMTLDDILDGFAEGKRTDLYDVFSDWQDYVDAQGSQGNDVVKQFQKTVGYACWGNI